MTHIGTRIGVPAFVGEAGVARRDISPPVGIRARNWGPATWNASEGNHHLMTLTAVALRGAESGGLSHLLLAVDGTWWRRVDDEWRVRGAILEQLGLDASQLMLALSHTHAGPVLCARDAHLEGGELIAGYLEMLVAAAVSAGREAMTSFGPARLEWATGHCSLASNRELDLDGRAVVGFNPDADADDTVVVGRLSGHGGRTLATIVNYACHPTTLAWQNRLVSPDYVGGLRSVVEAETGVPCAFLQGASGELAPRQQYSGDLSVADRHGTSLGHAVLSALASLPAVGTALELSGVIESGAPLAMWEARPADGSTVTRRMVAAVELDLVELPSLKQFAEKWADIDPRSREERLRRARNLREGYICGPTVQHPVWAWRLGDAIFVAHPGEAYSPLQGVLRERFPESTIVVMNLTNGPGFVYLPTREAYQRGAYQAWQTPLAPGSLERLEDHATSLIRSLLEDTQ